MVADIAKLLVGQEAYYTRELGVFPTSVVDEDCHRYQAVERGVGSAVIVGPQPPGEGAAAFGSGVIQPPIGPLLQAGVG